ncbi:unnamed protein product [Moneuplotes crassus]|uniref:RanBP2-type domain-containing protein n=1 Tax=Euplotes crassus TaxID=5936 RepID=A0AAD1XIB5_EUPCR|nr:unnamed protein product [Moneuplotes crassus]
MDRAITCKICHQKFFPASMKFHVKECQKKYDATHEKCCYCAQKIFKPDLHRHEDICKTVPTHHKSSKGKVHTISSIESGKYGIPDSQGLLACKGCNRKFAAYRIGTHENICLGKKQPGAPSRSTLKPKQTKKAVKKPTINSKQVFQGKGVMVNSTFDDDQNLGKKSSGPGKTFSGLKKKTKKYQPKIVYNWRCTYCMVVNNIENTCCKKCKKQRDLTPEETKAKEKEIDEFDLKKHRLSEILGSLESELTDSDFRTCVKKLKVILMNINDHPDEKKYRRIKLDNKKFHQTVGRHDKAIEFLLSIGFKKIFTEETTPEASLSYDDNTTSELFKHTVKNINIIVDVLVEEEEVKCIGG